MLGSSMRASAADSTAVQDCRQHAGRCSDRVDRVSVFASVRAHACSCVHVRVSCACLRHVRCVCVCVYAMCACGGGYCTHFSWLVRRRLRHHRGGRVDHHRFRMTSLPHSAACAHVAVGVDNGDNCQCAARCSASAVQTQCSAAQCLPAHCSAAQRSAVAARVTALRVGACVRSAVAFTGKELETYDGRAGCFALLPGSWLGWGCAVRSSGSGCSGRFGCTCVEGVRQLRRKRPAGGGSVPESTGAATDDAPAVGFARLASLAAVMLDNPWERAATTAGLGVFLLFICRAQTS